MNDLSTSSDLHSDDESVKDNEGKEKDRDNNNKKNTSNKEKSNHKRRTLEYDFLTTSDEQYNAKSINDNDDTENYVNGLSDEK